MDIGRVYADGRARVSELVAPLTDEEAVTPVPTCPAWSVRDVVAHLAGTCADILAGNLEGVATDSWTAAQVEDRRGRSLAEVLAEWTELAPQVEALAAHFPGRSGEQWITDATTHEHDVRAALARPGARDAAGVEIALDFLLTVGFDPSLRGRGLPALEVRSGPRAWTVGGDSPAGAVEVSPFELFRALTGRRSVDQVRAWAWTVDPVPYLRAFTFGPFRPSRSDVVE